MITPAQIQMLKGGFNTVRDYFSSPGDEKDTQDNRPRPGPDPLAMAESARMRSLNNLREFQGRRMR